MTAAHEESQFIGPSTVHRFGDDINTDVIIAAQHKAAYIDVAQMARHTFEDIDPDFVHRVHLGDVVVAGSNFGCGSSRETAPRVLTACGVAAVLAPSFARIFYRNAVNTGLPAIECDTSGIEAGDVVGIDLRSGTVTVEEKRLVRSITPMSDVMQKILDAGGLIPYLKTNHDLASLEHNGPHPTH